jgi:hypothetical protein
MASPERAICARHASAAAACGPVAELEQRWRKQLPPGAFDTACHTLDDLLSALENDPATTQPRPTRVSGHGVGI